MSSQTGNYALPYPVLTDPPNVPSDMQALAQAVDDQLTGVSAATLPVWDDSNSVQLAADHDCAANDSPTLVSSTFVLARDQTVLVGGRAQFANQNGSLIGKVGIRIEIDGSLSTHALTAGWQWAGTSSNGTTTGAAERPILTISNHPVLLSAGSHTVRLVAYRGGEAVTLTAQSGVTANGTSFYPTYLTVIV